jgi:hypothetical protein
MEAFKFLRPGRVGQISGIQWPADRGWVESVERPRLCRTGIHALRAEVLPMWIAEELWRVEVSGLEECGGILVGHRGRLLEQVTAWNDQSAREFAAACADNLPAGGPPLARARAADVLASVETATAGPEATTVGYMAAQAAEAAAPGGYAAERRRQARWLSDRLGLVGG